jgi:hypothetical protein
MLLLLQWVILLLLFLVILLLFRKVIEIGGGLRLLFWVKRRDVGLISSTTQCGGRVLSRAICLGRVCLEEPCCLVLRVLRLAVLVFLTSWVSGDLSKSIVTPNILKNLISAYSEILIISIYLIKLLLIKVFLLFVGIHYYLSLAVIFILLFLIIVFLKSQGIIGISHYFIIFPSVWELVSLP